MGATDPELVAYLKGLPGEKRVVMEACMFWEHTYDAAASVASSVTGTWSDEVKSPRLTKFR